MSKRKEKRNTASEQDRLIKLWPMLQQQILNQITDGHQETIVALSKLLPEAKYSELPIKSQHCVICHGMYNPKYPEQCTIMHDSERNQKREYVDKTGSVWSTTCTM